MHGRRAEASCADINGINVRTQAQRICTFKFDRVFFSLCVFSWLKSQSAPFVCQEAGIAPPTAASAGKAAAKKTRKARRKAAVATCTTSQPASNTAAEGHEAHARDSESVRVSATLRGSERIREGSFRPDSTFAAGAAADAPESLNVEAAGGLPANSAAPADAAVPAWQMCRLTKVGTPAGLTPSCSLSISGTNRADWSSTDAALCMLLCGRPIYTGPIYTGVALNPAPGCTPVIPYGLYTVIPYGLCTGRAPVCKF